MPEWSALSVWDWSVIVVLASSTAAGLYSGLVRTAFALASWFVAFLFCSRLALLMSEWIPWLSPRLAQLVVAFFVLLLLTRIVGSLVASAVRWAGLGPVDRVAGLALGVVRALLVLAVCALAAERFGLTGHPSFERSLSRPLLAWLIERAEPYWDQEFSIPQRTGG